MIGSVSLLLWTAVILPFAYCFYNFIIFYLDVRRRAKYVHKFPGVPPHPLWGHIHEFPGPNEAGLKFMRERAALYPRLGKVWFGPFLPTVSLVHPETVKEILKTSEPKPWNVGAYRLIYPWLGDGLLLSKGSKWNRNRRLLTPAFHFDILKPYMAVNNRCADVFLDKMEKFAAKGEYFEVFTHISLLTLDVMLRCAFSYENDCQIRGDDHPYVKAVNELQEMAVYRLLSPWLYPDVIFKLTPGGRKFLKNCDFVHSVSEEIMEKRKSALDAGEVPGRGGRYLDFLDILLTAKDDGGQGLTNPEIRDEVDTFLFEGHDTTASGVSWTLFSLAANPEIQMKCHQEVDEVLEGRDSDDILWDDLPKLKYLTMCIKEALRLHTPVPFIERQTTKDRFVDGLLLPAGTVVDIHLYVLHHNPIVWDEPMEYRPDRFLPENIQKMDSYAFVPFSAGPRNCIGQHFAMHEMKALIAKILRRFDLSLHPTLDVGHKIVVVMKTENGMYMKASPR